MTTAAQRGPSIANQPLPACPHHWDIESAKGPTAQGVCRLCGATRSFQNTPQHLTKQTWGKEPEWQDFFRTDKRAEIMADVAEGFARDLYGKY